MLKLRTIAMVVVMNLFAAVESNDPARVQELASQGVDLNERDHLGRTALLVASTSPQAETVNVLLQVGADPNIADASGLTPLMWAATYQRDRSIKALLDAGADPCVKDTEGHTALWHSLRRVVHFTVPYRRGRHVTLFLPRVLRTPTTRLLAVALAACRGR
jgi:hypothetical protein